MGVIEPSAMWPVQGDAMIEDYEFAISGTTDEPGLRGPPPRPVQLRPATLSSMLLGAFVVGGLAGWALASLTGPRRD
jgi:hypothetical protein